MGHADIDPWNLGPNAAFIVSALRVATLNRPSAMIRLDLVRSIGGKRASASPTWSRARDAADVTRNQRFFRRQHAPGLDAHSF